jgi:prevent-host-death family protein
MVADHDRCEVCSVRQIRSVSKQPTRRSSKAAGPGLPATLSGLEVVQATTAKNRFGAILKRARTGAPVVISKRGIPEFVVMEYQRYHALVHNTRGRDEQQLDALRDEFDALYAQMQSAKSRQSVDRLLSASAASVNQTAARRLRHRA